MNGSEGCHPGPVGCHPEPVGRTPPGGGRRGRCRQLAGEETPLRSASTKAAGFLAPPLCMPLTRSWQREQMVEEQRVQPPEALMQHLQSQGRGGGA